LLSMPASHLQALRRHYLEFPLGDFRTQQLLAQLIIMFHAANKDKNSKPLELDDVAPWLVTEGMRKARRRRNEMSRQSLLLDMVRGANS